MSAIRTGYKQTEVGVIPEEWEDAVLADVTEIRVGRDLIEDRFSQEADSRFRFPVFSNTVSNRGLYGYYSIPEYEGDSLTVVGRGVGLGTAFVRTGGYGAIGRLLVLHPAHGRADARYLTGYINHRVTIFFETGGIPQLTGIQFAKYKVALPLLPEQQAIAETLSDADALIESLEQLLTKKRHLKQAAMQELLTGKKRLPGFCGEWRRATLGQIISRFSTGLNPRENFKLNEGGNVFYVTIKSISEGRLQLDERCDLINEAARQKINERSDLKKDDILFSSIGRVGDAYLIPETPKAWNINESVFVLRPDQSQVVPLMLFYLLTSKEIKDALEQGVTGSTFQSIKQAQLKAISCRLPVSPLEQIAIADILSDMDAEITELEAELAKTRALKQGMMQKLLTGEIRLL